MLEEFGGAAADRHRRIRNCRHHHCRVAFLTADRRCAAGGVVRSDPASACATTATSSMAVSWRSESIWRLPGSHPGSVARRCASGDTPGAATDDRRRATVWRISRRWVRHKMLWSAPPPEVA
jgi:hypothetical protein